jgi:hypothetical protein
MKYILIMILIVGCSRYIQTDYNAYGVIKGKKVKNGLNLYKVELTPEITIKYESLDNYSVGDTVLIQSKIK